MIQPLCPRCRAPLSEAAGALTCQSCGQVSPRLGSVQCLVSDPSAYCSQWLARLERYGALARDRSRELNAQAQAPATASLRRERLIRLARGLDVEQSVLGSLFSPLQRVAGEPSGRSLLEAAVEDPLAVSRYSEHLFRDWVWGQAENERTLNLVTSLLPKGCGSVAVLGAGTGRLALDLVTSGVVTDAYALDLNPLPLLVADHLLSGVGLTLPEFPQFPLSNECVVVYRNLSFSGPRPSGLHLVLADALDPPFAAGSFDAVLTPWFLDDVAAEVGVTIATVNRLLAPGGTWVNVGPLQFARNASQACSIEEVFEVATNSGFAIERSSAQDLAYFESPVSGTRRIDRIYAFNARKARDAMPAVPLAATLAPSGAAQPVPRTGRLESALQQAVLTAGIASLVDGRRTTLEIAAALAAEWGGSPEELLAPLVSMLERLI